MATIVNEQNYVRMIRDMLNDRVKKMEKKINMTTALSLWKNPAHRAYKSKRRRRR